MADIGTEETVYVIEPFIAPAPVETPARPERESIPDALPDREDEPVPA